MSDPNTEAQRDRAEAEKLRWEERQEPNAQVRKDFERAAQDYDAEADELENESAEPESVEPEAPEEP